VPSFRTLDATDIPALAYVSSTATQAINTVLAGPGGGASAAPTFRGLVANDIPTLAYLGTNVDAPLSGTGTSASHLKIPPATTSVSGYLTSADFTTFNGKLSAVTANTPITGSGTPGSPLTILAATSTVNGYLTSADWSTFNGKQATLSSNVTIKTVNGTSLLGAGDVGTIDAGHGGTGFATYTVGDILYASGSAALSKLADVATGYALISGGVGVAPSWDKIGLTTHVTGTLPFGNGGTGQSTYTDGQLLIGNSATGGLSKATLSAGSNITITNGNGTISIAAASGGIAIPTAAGNKYARLGRNTASTLTATTDLTWYGPDVYNVKDYGATANSSTSATANDTAISNAVTALLANSGGTLYFPDGEWFISAPIVIAQSNKNVTVAGNGVGVTTITQTTNSKNAFTITQASRVDQTTVTGMTVRHNINSALSSGVAIYISNSVDGANDVVPNSIIDKVYVGNAPGTASAFTYGLQLRNQKVCFVSDYAYCGNNANGGTGILFEASGGSLPGQKCIATYVSNSNFGLCNVGIQIKNSLETCVITNCLMAGMTYGIQTDYMIHLGVFNSHINASVSAIYSTGTGGDVDQFAFQGCLLYAQAVNCVTISGGFTRGTISGTTFVCPSHDSGTGAINLTSGSGVNITGCSFYNYASYCIKLGSSTSQCLVSEMTYSGATPTDYVLDSGSNQTGLIKVYTGVFSPSGSVASYDIDIDTTLAFLGKRPVAGTVCCTNSGDVLGRFDFDASSRNNMRISFVNRAGGNLGTGPYRYSAAIFPTS
jgi:hypothetical protein